MDKIDKQATDQLFFRISSLIEKSRDRIVTTVNVAMVYTNYEIGRYIVENEQEGHHRASYGKSILIDLSRRLTTRFGTGWSVENLTLFRKFFSAYSNIADSVYDIINIQSNKVSYTPLSEIVNTVYDFQPKQQFSLSWSHYLILMRIKNLDARSFYEIECANQQWSVRELSRQVGSSLYERLALSRDRNEVMRLAKEGQTIEKPSDIIKSPLTLEFLGLKVNAAYNESKLENAIINKLQDFLLELGKGFLFEARQKRLTFEEQHFYVDLVLYNRLLQAFVLVDLKTNKLTHQDLGQMQMYVNYYDRFVKQDFEKPTIGILLCQEKNDALVELTLPKDANIYATEYALYLPNKSLLQIKLKEWINEFEEETEDSKL